MRPILFYLYATLSTYVSAQNLSLAELSAVKANLWAGAQQTWELGVEAEALTEYNSPQYSVVYNLTTVPPATPGSANATRYEDSFPYNFTGLDPVYTIAYNAAANRSNASVPQPIIWVDGGAAGDPVSLGVAMLLANWTEITEPPLNQPTDYTGFGNATGRGVTYLQAAQDQLEYLLTVVPRTSDGAISHRIEQVQLWSDNVYMVPPFLAYYGAMTGNQTLLSEAYNQIKLYRSYLYDSDASPWKHIVLGYDNRDPGFWSTGNAWAAAGMIRVLATIQHSAYVDDLQTEIGDLTTWIEEIHSGMYSNLQSNTSLFHNYANDTSTFVDASSTALLASTVYRLALLAGVHTYLSEAERSRKAFSSSGNWEQWGTGNDVGPASSITAGSTDTSSSLASTTASTSTAPSASSSSTLSSSYSYSYTSYSTAAPTSPVASASALLHFSPEMWLAPVVDPYDWSVQGGSSPEGQAFVVLMYAAWRDWMQAGSQGANGALAVRDVGMGMGMVTALAGAVGMLLAMEGLW